MICVCICPRVTFCNFHTIAISLSYHDVINLKSSCVPWFLPRVSPSLFLFEPGVHYHEIFPSAEFYQISTSLIPVTQSICAHNFVFSPFSNNSVPVPHHY